MELSKYGEGKRGGVSIDLISGLIEQDGKDITEG